MTTATFAEVVEGVRATIAEYTHALDDGRTDDVVATYLPDGSFEMPGAGTFQGLDALRATYERWAPRVPQRHLINNTLVTDWSEHEATAVSDVVLLVQVDDEWKVQFVGRYRDSLRLVDGEWKFQSRVVS